MPDSPIANCKFEFECPQQLSALRTTDTPNVYFCSQCREHVYRCQDRQELIEHSQQGHCVVFQYERVEAAIAEGEIVRVIAGPFTGFDMQVVRVQADRQTATLYPHHLMGRIMPIDVDMSLIEKIAPAPAEE